MDFSKYQYYQFGDFLEDEYFRKWISQPSDEECANFWFNFLLLHPEKAEQVQQAANLLSALHKEAESYYPQAGQLTAAREKLLSNYEKRKKIKKGPNRLYALVGVAASILLCLALGVYVFYPHPGVPATITYTSGYAENKTIELPDGSVVTLNAQSSLRLPEGGWKKDREVWLAGEAFFRISKSANGKRKFLVHTAEATIEVLGTQFNVDARRQKTDVVLAAGSIRLSTRDSVLILAPGDRAVYDGQRNELILEKVSPEDHTAWREGMIVFKNKTLEEVATKLQDIYGKKIVIRDEQKRSMRLFLSVDTNDLDEFLNILQTLEGDQLTISKEGETIILE